jgi:SEL1 protein
MSDPLFQYLAFMYSVGLGVKANSAKALLFYINAAAAGDTFARIAIGYRYWTGVSVLQSCETALAYYR